MNVKTVKMGKRVAMSSGANLSRCQVKRTYANLFKLICWPLPSQWIGSSMVAIPKIHWVPHLAPAHTGARVVGVVNVKSERTCRENERRMKKSKFMKRDIVTSRHCAPCTKSSIEEECQARPPSKKENADSPLKRKNASAHDGGTN